MLTDRDEAVRSRVIARRERAMAKQQQKYDRQVRRETAALPAILRKRIWSTVKAARKNYRHGYEPQASYYWKRRGGIRWPSGQPMSVEEVMELLAPLAPPGVVITPITYFIELTEDGSAKLEVVTGFRVTLTS